MKLSTINLLVEGVLVTSKKRYESILTDCGVAEEDCKERIKELAEAEVNTLCIILKTAYTCETEGLEEALLYYEGTHTEDEFQEFRISVIPPKLNKIKKRAKKNDYN